MIFNEMNTNTTSYEAVQESPYELGIGGALMHVYENECNYNAIMKAAALSEMKYYNQTGGDLFVQEAGAFSSFLTRVKDFFKKVIEKIKSILHKFMAVINQYTMKDKDFVKKYETELGRKNLKDFEFNGYKFEKLKGEAGPGTIVSAIDSLVDKIKFKDDGTSDQDDINDVIEKNRASILAGSSSNSVTESEFRDELKEMLYGDKEDINVGNVGIRTFLQSIRGAEKAIKTAQSEQKKAEKTINDIIKKLENEMKNEDKTANAGAKSNASDVEQRRGRASDIAVKRITVKVDVCKAYVNDITVYFGALVKALKDQNRQAKAICVKALSYKATNESAVYENTTTYGDIFAGVEII